MNKLKLSERDIRVIKYAYDMKFCTSFDVRKLFFETDKVDGKRYAQIRLKKMREANFLNSFESNLYKERFYFLGSEGLKLLKESYQDEIFPKNYADSPDLRSAQHDKNVALCRVALERQGLAKSWVSERQITHSLVTKSGEYRSKYMLQNLRSSSIPDGLFETRKGEVCAFELEYSMKSRRELKTKLVNLLRESNVTEGLFKRVLVVAGSDKIYKAIESVCSEIDASFKIMKLQELIDSLEKVHE